MGRIIGIDLGTTTSEIAYIKDSKPHIIQDSFSNSIIPSVVGIIDGDIIAGHIANNRIKSNKSNIVSEFKREIGNDDSYIYIGDEKFMPHEISAMLLKHLKEVAQNYFKEEVTEVVITVPANFNSYQRELTKKAGEMAGLNVERIINEPTAAAMAYGIDNLDEEANILVYDLGGGTFDVTVLEMFNGILDVKSSRGNNKLGGADFDKEIAKYMLEQINNQNQIDLYESIGENDEEIEKIKHIINDYASNAKKELSVQKSTDINIPFITLVNNRPISLSVELTREKFDELTYDLVQSTKYTINEALEAANMTKENIDIVLLVGGSSRIVAVNKLVNNMFPDKVKGGLNPDEAVAMGAAVCAGIKSKDISREDGLIVTDKSSYNLGTSVIKNIGNRELDGMFDCIIPVDTNIPCSKSKVYYTSYDYQTQVYIQVYEGYDEFVENNTKISGFTVEGIPKSLAGEEQIEVEFTYNLNGILEVKVTILSTGKVHKEIINNKEFINVSSSASKYFETENLESWREYPLAKMVRRSIELAEKKLPKLNDSESKLVKEALRNLKKAVIEDNEMLVEQYDEELTDILFDCRTV